MCCAGTKRPKAKGVRDHPHFCACQASLGDCEVEGIAAVIRLLAAVIYCVAAVIRLLAGLSRF